MLLPDLYLMLGWTDDLQFYILFNTISVISGRWADDNEKAVCNGTLFTVEKTLPQAGLTRSIGQRSPTELLEFLPNVACHMVSNVHVRQSFETMYMLRW